MDELKNLAIYDIITKQALFTEMNITTVCFNSDFDDLLAYASENMFFVKLASQPSTILKMQGSLLGFKASKLFISGKSLTTLDIPQTSYIQVPLNGLTNIQKFVEKQDFAKAYSLACLGVGEGEWMGLGVDALTGGEFESAQKCFQRLAQSVQYCAIQWMDLCAKWRPKGKSVEMQAEILCY